MQTIYSHLKLKQSAVEDRKVLTFSLVSFLHLPVLIVFSAVSLLAWSCDMTIDKNGMQVCDALGKLCWAKNRSPKANGIQKKVGYVPSPDKGRS